MFPPKVPDWPVEVAYDDLPAWMRGARRVVDWPLLAVLALAAALIAPLVAGPLPWSAGLRAEVARALEISESIQAGILYPRWAADFNMGYGSPLWNFLPPLPHYFAGLHQVLAQTSTEFSVRFTLIGAHVLLAVALFAFARRRWGTYAGLIATALGLFSPQIALVKPLIDGDLGALLAAGFWLASLWALDRLLAQKRGADVLLAAGACAAVWLAHQPLNAVFSALTLAWLLIRALAERQGDAVRAGLLAYTLGFAASAFYWLPAWSERDAVIWRSAPGAEPAVTQVTLAEIFRAFPLPDRAAINPQPVATLGVALWVAAAIALLLIVVSGFGGRRRTQGGGENASRLRAGQAEGLFFALAGALLLVGAILPVSRVWESAAVWPPFAPRDLVFPAAICLALLGSTLGAWLEASARYRWAAFGMLAIAAAIAVANIAVLVPPSPPAPGVALTRSGLLESELRGVPLSGREAGWLLPRGVAGLPTVETQFVSSYDSGLSDKVIRDNLPATTLADTIEHTPQRERIMVHTVGSAEITLRTFLFDGWRAQLDGEPLALHATESGLIALNVPEGDHELVVSFGATAARTVGWLLSAAASLLVLGLAVRQEHQPPALLDEDGAFAARPARGRAEPIFLVGMVVLLAGAALAARLRPHWASTLSPPGNVLHADAALPARFQGGIDLLAYDLTAPAERGAPIALTLYWRGWRPDLPDYQVDLQLVSADDASQVYPLNRRRHPGQIPTGEWPRWPLHERYIVDSYTLTVPGDALPGRYRITVQIGRCAHLDPAPCPAITPVFAQTGDRTNLEQFVVLKDEIAIAR